MKQIENYLKQHGSCLSSEVVDFLVREGSISPDAARKQISRLRDPICRLKRGFPKRETFLYLRDQRNTPEYLDSLSLALKKTGSALGRAIASLEARGGVTRLAYFPIATGLPVMPCKKQISHSTAEEILKELGLIRSHSTGEVEVVDLIASSRGWQHRRAVELTENMVLGALKPWMVNLGFSSGGTLRIRTDDAVPTFGPFNWDMVGPCYLAGLAKRTASTGIPQNAFVVGDIVLGESISLDNLKPFFHKCDTILRQSGQRPFLPVFVADSFKEDALKELRKRGCLIAMPSTVWGPELAKQLRELISTIENAAAAVAADPDRVFRLFESLSRIEGIALNMRGVLFELIVAHLFKLQGYSIDIREKVITQDGCEAEIDVFAKRSDELVCIECKAKAPKNLVGLKEVKDWVEGPRARIGEWLGATHQNKRTKRFEFRVSSDFTDEAHSYIVDITDRHTKYPIRFLTGRQTLEELKTHNQSSLIHVFQEQFSSS